MGLLQAPSSLSMGWGGRRGCPTPGPSGDPSHMGTPLTLSIYNQFKHLTNSRGSPEHFQTHCTPGRSPAPHAAPRKLSPTPASPRLDLGNYILRFPQHLFLIQRSGGEAGTGGVGSVLDGSEPRPAFPRAALRRLHILISSLPLSAALIPRAQG